MNRKALAVILRVTAAAEQALIAFTMNDQKGARRYLTAARDAIDAALASLGDQ